MIGLEEMSVLPGRIRFKNLRLYSDKPLAFYINVYIHHLYGVKYSKVNHITSSILVIYDPQKTNHGLIRQNIDHAIEAAIRQRSEVLAQYKHFCETIEKRDRAKRNFLFYGLLYVLFKVKQSMYGKFSLSRNLRVLQLASAVTIIGGYPLVKGIYKRFAKHIPTDSEILLKLTAVSFTILRESTKGVFVLLLKQLNDYIKLSADVECQRMLNQTMHKTAGMVWMHGPHNQEILVPVENLSVGQVVGVHKGEMISVKGQVLEGPAVVNSLYYTGQPVATRIGEGSKVYEGMTVLSGKLKVKVDQLPESRNKCDIPMEQLRMHRRVEHYRKHIAPISIGAAVLSYLATGNIVNGLSVILLLCPSASGTALTSGIKSCMSLLKKHNIYLRNVNTFEKIIDTDHIVFDKTGTLTYGQMQIKEVIVLDQIYSENELLNICAACEADQYHPIAVTFKQEMNDYDIAKVQSSVLLPSKGVEAVYDGNSVLIGNQKLMSDHRIDVTKGLKQYEVFEKRLYTPVFISINNRLAGIIALQDILRDDAFEMVDKLKYRGLTNISLLTGDGKEKAQAIGQALHIRDIYSDCSYEDKGKVIEQKKKTGIVMMVGDGVNDVMAMKQADVSVSFADCCCDKVKLHSDCIIFEDDMERLADFIRLSQKSYRYVNQSIMYSKLHNITLGVLAFFGYFNPFAAKSFNTVNSLIVLLLNKRIEYLSAGKIVRGSAFGGSRKVFEDR